MQVLKRHARPIRELQGEESEIFTTLFPKHKIVKGGCDHGFRHVTKTERKKRLISISAQGATRAHVCFASDHRSVVRGRLIAVTLLVPANRHVIKKRNCYVMDTETVCSLIEPRKKMTHVQALYVLVGPDAPKRVVAKTFQFASCMRMREHVGSQSCE